MKSLIVIPFLFGFLTLLSQVPNNFEFLYHDHQFSLIGASEVVDDGVLFVGHQEGEWMTTIAIAKFDNTIDTLFNSSFSSQCKMLIERDSTIHILIYQLLDYDVGMEGFYHLVYKEGESSVFSYDYESIDSNSPLWTGVEDVMLHSTFGYVIKTRNEEYFYFDGFDTEEIDIENGSCNFFNTNDFGKPFL